MRKQKQLSNVSLLNEVAYINVRQHKDAVHQTLIMQLNQEPGTYPRITPPPFRPQKALAAVEVCLTNKGSALGPAYGSVL